MIKNTTKLLKPKLGGKLHLSKNTCLSSNIFQIFLIFSPNWMIFVSLDVQFERLQTFSKCQK
jgi:hypothetical protein